VLKEENATVVFTRIGKKLSPEFHTKVDSESGAKYLPQQ
jgi:hypothetical protein